MGMKRWFLGRLEPQRLQVPPQQSLSPQLWAWVTYWEVFKAGEWRWGAKQNRQPLPLHCPGKSVQGRKELALHGEASPQPCVVPRTQSCSFQLHAAPTRCWTSRTKALLDAMRVKLAHVPLCISLSPLPCELSLFSSPKHRGSEIQRAPSVQSCHG